jgi:hypothetical protein
LPIYSGRGKGRISGKPMIQKTLGFLPVGFRSKIEQWHGLIQILNNIRWLFVDKILRVDVGLVVGV